MQVQLDAAFSFSFFYSLATSDMCNHSRHGVVYITAHFFSVRLLAHQRHAYTTAFHLLFVPGIL